MAPEKKVIDASVAVKWFLNENGSSAARKLFEMHAAGEITLLVPELLFLEVMNVLRYKRKSVRDLSAAAEALSRTKFVVQKIDQTVLAQSARIALEYNLSMYDALYAAIAQMFGVQLITADKALSQVPNTVLLKE